MLNVRLMFGRHSRKVSDMTDQWNQLKELKGVLAALIAAAVFCMAIGGALMEWRIEVAVGDALSAQDLGTDSKIVSMDDEIDANGARAEAAIAAAAAVNTRVDGNECRVEQAFGILSGRDPVE